MVDFNCYKTFREDLTIRYGLTPLQCDIVVLVTDGLSNAEIAERIGFGFTERAIKQGLANIYSLMGVNSRAQLIVWALHRMPAYVYEVA